MRISPNGLKLIQSFEGFIAKPYYCPAGYRTIGYGHVLRQGEEYEQITESEAQTLLEQDVEMAEDAIHRLIQVNLSQNQYDALCSFTFNVGNAALQRSTLRRKVNRKEFMEAADEFLRWTRGGGIILPGLVKRRLVEQELFLSYSAI